MFHLGFFELFSEFYYILLSISEMRKLFLVGHFSEVPFSFLSILVFPLKKGNQYSIYVCTVFLFRNQYLLLFYYETLYTNL